MCACASGADARQQATASDSCRPRAPASYPQKHLVSRKDSS